MERLRKCPAPPLREVVRLLGPHEDGCQAIHAPAELPSVGRGHHPFHHEIDVPPCVPDVTGGLMPALPLRQPADFAPRLALVRRDADAEVSAMPKYVEPSAGRERARMTHREAPRLTPGPAPVVGNGDTPAPHAFREISAAKVAGCDQASRVEPRDAGRIAVDRLGIGRTEHLHIAVRQRLDPIGIHRRTGADHAGRRQQCRILILPELHHLVLPFFRPWL